MTLYVKSGSFIIFLVILMQFCGKIEGTAVTCEPKYEFLPCTSGTWGTLFLIVIYQYLITIGQKYISDGSNKFFSLIGPGIFGASLFHVLANFPTLFLVLQSGLSSDDKARSSSSSGMNMLTGSAIMSLTIIWPSVITFGSYDLSDDNDHFIIEDEPSFLTKLTAYGVITDKETTYTARIMLVSLVPFIILQLPAIISSISITRVIILVTLIVVSTMFITNIVYQIFEPSIQNRRFAYVTKRFVKDKLQTLLSKNGKPNVRLIKKIYKELDKNHDGKVSKYELKIFLQGVQMQPGGSRKDDFVETIMDRFDISGDEYINETEFVRVLTIWLQDARKSVFQNDYDPLTFFLTPKPEAADKEQQKPLIPKETRNPRSSILDFLGALSLIFIGIAIMVLISSSFISNVAAFATLTNVPSFLIPYLIIPCAINIPRLLATIQSATQKTERATSLTFSRIYTGVSMSSMSTLTIFLLLVYVRDLPWEVSAQAFVVLIIGGGMAVFTSTRTVFPLWTGYVIYLLYPISLLMLYLLTVVWV